MRILPALWFLILSASTALAQSSSVKVWDGTRTATVRDTGSSDSLNVAIVDGSGNQVASFGGGTQYTEGDIDASVTGTAVIWKDAADTLRVASAAKPLPVGDGGGSLTVDGTLTCNAGTNLNTSALATESTLSTLNGKVTAVNTGAVVVSSSALPSGASTAAKQPALGTAGTASADVITVQGITSMTPLLVNGSAVTQPVSGTFWQATQPVSLASVPSHAVTNAGTFAVQAAQSGTWTVQPGNTANTTAWLTQNTPATSGGFTTYHLVSAGTTNATNIKASAGQVYGWYIYNSNAAMRKVCLHNSASAPTAGASIFFCLPIPGGAAANVFNDTGIAFSSGIGITTVTDLADSGTTAVAANDLNINLFYK